MPVCQNVSAPEEDQGKKSSNKSGKGKGSRGGKGKVGAKKRR